MDRKTVTMDFGSLATEKDEDDSFFDSCERLSSAVPINLMSGSYDDEDDDDEFFEASRMSLVSASIKRIYSIEPVTSNSSASSIILPGYDMWIAEPGDVKERRKRLLQGMGLTSNKELLRLVTSKSVRAISIKLEPDSARLPPTAPAPVQEEAVGGDSSMKELKTEAAETEAAAAPPPPSLRAIVLVRSRSDGDIELFSTKIKQRKEEVFGPTSKNKLIRTLSGKLVPTAGISQYACAVKFFPENEKVRQSSQAAAAVLPDDGIGSFFLIKNLDTGKDFIVKDINEQGMWNKLNDVQTGKQLTMEEFEKSVGYSPVVKELMRRASRSADGRKGKNSQITKGFRNSTKKGSALLKSIKGAATGLLVEKEDDHSCPPPPPPPSSSPPQAEQKNAAKVRTSQWIDAHQTGKSYKEFTALHLSQEIQAHDGSIWTMRFSSDSRYLASAGEDSVIHVWEVQECEVVLPQTGEDSGEGGNLPNRLEISSMPLKKGRKSSGMGNSVVPEFVKMPETVVTLSEKPICSFQGHKDEVLDLSWSKSQLLLSSSMDKTVKIWDMETKSCLKTFAHKDYVTCIQFNTVDEKLFISGSLDGKVRIWSIPDNRVVDWTDVHEMVTAASYTPDAQGAVIGTQEGSCSMYSTDDSRLEHKMDIQKKKKVQAKKFPAFQSQAKKIPGFQSPAPLGKITGFQFAPWNPSEVLITSADSRIGIYNGADLVQKFKGFKNTSSQISASFSPHGKHIISASEDSQVYIWKVEESKNPGSGKKRSTITVQSHEHFQCKDVSVAITWPGSSKTDPPVVDFNAKKKSKRQPTAPVTPPNPTTTEQEAEPQNSNTNTSSLPPLPKKKAADENVSCGDDQEPVDQANNIAESVSDSESPGCATPQDNASSHSSSSSSHGIQATAWGMVIVTASLEGEIRVYQNFGLPLKIARQLF